MARFVKGQVPHNKRWYSCKIKGCERTDMKGLGLCQKHYKLLQLRRKNGQDYSEEALTKRLPRTAEHVFNNSANRNPSSSLKGKTYKDIYGDRAEEIAKKRMGENSGTWKGGKSFELYSPLFNFKLKEEIRKRDNFRCCECGSPQDESIRRLEVHHIDENKKNNDKSNLISLCKSCHRKVHNSKNDWKIYFYNILKENSNVSS